MKKLVFTIAGAFLLIACTKTVKVETTETVEDGKTTTTTTTTETGYDIATRQAESDYRAAEEEVVLARQRGDIEAEREAKINAAKAKKAWEDTKAGIQRGVDKTEAALNKVGDKIDSTFDKDQDGKVELK